MPVIYCKKYVNVLYMCVVMETTFTTAVEPQKKTGHTFVD